MSEYQYYEFVALDRPLSEAEMDDLRQVSSRAEVSSSRFVNVYHYGDFRGSVTEFMTAYFDAMIYVANWGTHRFMVRLPQDLADQEALAEYCAGESAEMKATDGFVVLDWNSRMEDFSGWEEGQGWLDQLYPLRADLLGGDLRAAYLGWLLCAQSGELDDETVEPPVPPGLAKLPESLRHLAEFLRIDPGLLAAAAEASGEATAPSTSFDAWIAKLPGAEKDRLLAQFAQGDDPLLGVRLAQRYRAEAATAGAAGTTGGQTNAGRRTASELLGRAERMAQELEARRQAEAAAARNRELDAITGRQQEIWQRVETLLAASHRRGYDEAAGSLRDLHDLAEREGAVAEFRARLAALQERHKGKRVFWNNVRRLKAME